MTRKHFEYAAEHIGKEFARDPVKYDGAVALAVSMFKKFGPAFNAERFERKVAEYAHRARNPRIT